jgi:hypothetical protein
MKDHPGTFDIDKFMSTYENAEESEKLKLLDELEIWLKEEKNHQTK